MSIGTIPETVPAPATIAEAIAHIRASSVQMNHAANRLLRLFELQNQPPEMRTVVINPANNGVYQVTDLCPWAAKSIGVLNPGSAPVFVGVGGVSARPTSRAPSCPGPGALILPVEVRDLELGCDPAVLGTATAVIYLFRYVTVQRLALMDST